MNRKYGSNKSIAVALAASTLVEMRGQCMSARIEQESSPLNVHTRVAGYIDCLDWKKIGQDLDTGGCAVIPSLLTSDECRDIAMLYPNDNLFRSHVYLNRHGFGRGEYKYFSYPLPECISNLRAVFYPHLVPIANFWYEQLGLPTRFPDRYDEFITRCHAAGQSRPTPLLLQYVTGDYNCLHQDLYGEHVFPLQVVVLLSEPGKDFCGGDFVITEQRPRMQSRVEVVPLTQGDALIFTVRYRPMSGKRGFYRVNMRHGVSYIRSGMRHALGIIFHDAL